MTDLLDKHFIAIQMAYAMGLEIEYLDRDGTWRNLNNLGYLPTTLTPTIQKTWLTPPHPCPLRIKPND